MQISGLILYKIMILRNSIDCFLSKYVGIDRDHFNILRKSAKIVCPVDFFYTRMVTLQCGRNRSPCATYRGPIQRRHDGRCGSTSYYVLGTSMDEKISFWFFGSRSPATARGIFHTRLRFFFRSVYERAPPPPRGTPKALTIA